VPYYVRDEYNLYYYDSGKLESSKPPIVFIHGYLGSSQAHWGNQLSDKELFSINRLIAPDLRGFGKSDIGKNRFGDFVQTHNTEDSIEDIRILLQEELGIQEDPIVCGYSIGGTLALVYSLRFPVKGIILVCPRPFLSKKTRSWRILAKEKRSGEKKQSANALLWRVVKRVQKLYAYFEVVIKKRISSTYLQQLQEIEVPILLLFAENDTVSPSISFEILRQNLPEKNSKVIIFQGDHGITHEQPELFKGFLKDFLSLIEE
jgi:pimeloyl-ACP methyl ester carboxylesterase